MNQVNMKKINKIFTIITIYVIALFALAIIGTYINDYLEAINWFKDWECKDTIFFPYGSNTHKHHRHGFMGVSRHYEGAKAIIWSAKHYWYTWGVTILWITSLIRGIVTVITLVDDKTEN